MFETTVSNSQPLCWDSRGHPNLLLHSVIKLDRAIAEGTHSMINGDTLYRYTSLALFCICRPERRSTVHYCPLGRGTDIELSNFVDFDCEHRSGQMQSHIPYYIDFSSSNNVLLVSSSLQTTGKRSGLVGRPETKGSPRLRTQ